MLCLMRDDVYDDMDVHQIKKLISGYVMKTPVYNPNTYNIINYYCRDKNGVSTIR